MIGIHYVALSLLSLLHSAWDGREYIVANMPLPLGEPETVVVGWNGQTIEALHFDNGWFERIGGDVVRLNDPAVQNKATDLLAEQQSEFATIKVAAHLEDSKYVPPVPDPAWQEDDQ